MATNYLSWFHPFDTVRHGGLVKGDVAWFLNGKLNVSYNCLDRHLAARGDKVALLWESDAGDSVRALTYRQVFEEVCRCANALKAMGVRRGDAVCIYMPMVPEAAIAMLACTRIGAPHSIVFAGFSAEALRGRIVDGQCRFVLTADEGMRAGRPIALKAITDAAIAGLDVAHVLVYRRTGAAVPMQAARDLWWHEQLDAQRPYCAPEWMDAEDTLFMLYTSGSTGKPKGIAHTTGGYLLYAAMTHKLVFDVRENDVYACMADIGWVTGHSYIVYGPLANASTTFMFESTPLFPDASRYWASVERHRISIFYTAPTAIRALMKFGEAPVAKHDLSSLRVLGSVGEPINPEAWRWYHRVVGGARCPIVDTFWQTETGGHMLTPLPFATPTKPGAATLPFFGVEPLLLDAQSGAVLTETKASGVLVFARAWPGMARTIYRDHQRFLTTYLTPYAGYYFTGDGADRDADGYYWITGRVDDVMNVSGHRIGTVQNRFTKNECLCILYCSNRTPPIQPLVHKYSVQMPIISRGKIHDFKWLFSIQVSRFYTISVRHLRTGSAEVESALVLHASIAEAAVIGIPHDIKGTAMFAYVTPKQGVAVTPQLISELRAQVRKEIGAFAVPDELLVTAALPKTRSGKIMRRILRKIAACETDSLGDVSTLAEPAVVDELIRGVQAMRAPPAK